MVWKRVVYAIILCASVAAFIATDSAAALFVTVCVITVPLVSFVILLVAKRRIAFDFSVRESCIRGGALQLDMKARVHPRFLTGYVKVVFEAENTTFGRTELINFKFNDLSYTNYTYDYISPDSGRICVRVKQLKLIDIFGICSVSVGCPKFAESFVSPMLYDDIGVHIAARGKASLSGETSVFKKGQDPTEIFDIRDYVAGDPLKAVHWKLSSKFDALKTREYGSTDDHKTLILVDLSRYSGDAAVTNAQLNGVLDIAVSVSGSLKADGYTHSVGWFDEGAFTCSEVFDGNSFVQMVNKLMSIKVKDGNSNVSFYLSHSPECAAFTKVILVAPSVDRVDIKNHADEDITAIVVCNDSAVIAEQGINIIEVPYNGVVGALAGRTL